MEEKCESNECGPEEKLKFKHIEDKIKQVLQRCYAMYSELELTETIILHGEDCSKGCVAKCEDRNAPTDRFLYMEEQLTEILTSLSKTREKIREQRTFFEK